MANPAHLTVFYEGVTVWNSWRERPPLVTPALTGANLQGLNLKKANLQQANLRGVDLREANLKQANLLGINLEGADLVRANLEGADLRQAKLAVQENDRVRTLDAHPGRLASGLSQAAVRLHRHHAVCPGDRDAEAAEEGRR